MLLANNARSNAMMNQFVEMGVHLAMDDFGTGYSSMSYLTKFRFNKIKIDRSFVQALDRGGEAIILAIVGMTRSLGIKSCAEGIETEEQMAALRVMGIDEVQGYLFGKPMPRPELIERFRLGRGSHASCTPPPEPDKVRRLVEFAGRLYAWPTARRKECPSGRALGTVARGPT